MTSIRYNHRYIHDGIVFNAYVQDENGRHVKVADAWTRFNRKSAKYPFKHLKSYDNGIVVNNVTDMIVCGSQDFKRLVTARGRQMQVPVDAYIMSETMTRVRDLGIGQPLKVVDAYKWYYGDKIKQDSHGNARLRAVLRNHGVDFEIDEHDGTVTDRGVLHCHDFDTDGPVEYNGHITYGINNYREEVKKLFGLADYSWDEIIGIYDAKSKYAVGIYVDGPQNIIVANGIILQSTQTEITRDR